jgi:K+-sensing histidine kinase KdpD
LIPGKAAREGNLLRTAIVDSLTHELRTPLTSIKACVTVLLTNSRLQPSQRNDLLTVIDEEADRLNHLVGEAVESAQLDAGMKLDLKPHAIEEIIEARQKRMQDVAQSAFDFASITTGPAGRARRPETSHESADAIAGKCNQILAAR